MFALLVMRSCESWAAHIAEYLERAKVNVLLAQIL